MISTKTSLTGLIQLAYFSLYLFVSYELSVLILVYRVFKVKRKEMSGVCCSLTFMTGVIMYICGV